MLSDLMTRLSKQYRRLSELELALQDEKIATGPLRREFIDLLFDELLDESLFRAYSKILPNEFDERGLPITNGSGKRVVINWGNYIETNNYQVLGFTDKEGASYFILLRDKSSGKVTLKETSEKCFCLDIDKDIAEQIAEAENEPFLRTTVLRNLDRDKLCKYDVSHRGYTFSCFYRGFTQLTQKVLDHYSREIKEKKESKDELSGYNTELKGNLAKMKAIIGKD